MVILSVFSYTYTYIKNKKVALISFVLFLSIWFYATGNNPVWALYKGMPAIRKVADTKNSIRIVDGADFGVPKICKGLLDIAIVEDQALVKTALDKVLDEDETFLDMTLNGLHYFVSDRKLWLEYPNYYVYPGTKPQKRAIEVLKERNIRVSLLGDNNLDHININTRAYPLYRYALLNGLPWEISAHQTILMPAEYFQKIGQNPPNKLQTLQILDKHFARPLVESYHGGGKELFFGYIPSIWGRGFKGFLKDFIEIASFDIANSPKTSLTIELPVPIEGTEASFLYIDIAEIEEKDGLKDSFMRVGWVNDELPDEINELGFMAIKGINLVPMDAAPRWLLADEISLIRITMDDGRQFRVRKIKIFGRK
jgi:hypothetical protein